MVNAQRGDLIFDGGSMKKNISICFRTSSVVLNDLKRIAREGHKSVSNVIESIIYDQLKTVRELNGIGQERRRYKRKKVSLPAFIMSARSLEKEFEPGTVLDISMGGIRFSVPKEKKLVMQTAGDDPEFSVIFILPHESRPVNIKCRSMQTYDEPDTFQVGAVLLDADFNSYQALNNYLN